MPLRRSIFEIGHPVHIISRSVDERKIFENEDDCFRYVFQIYAANIGKPAPNLWRQDIIKIAQSILCGEKISDKFINKEHKPLVDFLDFSFVVNHVHFYLIPNIEKAISILMRNLNSGFAQYFNLKHNRHGILFDGRYRSVVVENQNQSDTVSRYVSVINPLDVFQPGWRENGLENRERAFNFLKNYIFSSFPDKIGVRASMILASPEILGRYLTLGNDVKNYMDFVENFLNDRSRIPRDFFLE